MGKFEKGTTVISVNTQEKGVVVKVLTPQRGKQYYAVKIKEQEHILQEISLIEDVNLSDPFEKIGRNIFSTFENFLQTNTIFKLENTNNSNIPTLKSSKTIFKAYQFKPLLKLLSSNRRRLLVADEVGLGKTIEAGHIMLELRARKELSTALIVCPISLQKKWQQELEEKFNLKFKIYENLDDLIEAYRVYPSVLGIINYEKVRKLKDEKKKNNGNNSTKQSFDEILQKKGQRIDLLICDEAHRLRNSTTQAHKGIKEIIDSTKVVVFLTATPIMISRENLFNLLQLLDETEYNNYTVFENALRVNQPFLNALSRLNDGDNLKDIANELRERKVLTETKIGEISFPEVKTVEERFADIPLYSIIMDSLLKKKDSHANRVQLQFDISSLSKMNSIFSRTRKRDVTQDWSQAERNPHTEIITLNKGERDYFDDVIDSYIQENDAPLGLIQKKRQVASSVYAYMNEEEDLGQGIDKFKDYPDAKVEKLLEIINEVVLCHGKKLIVFALFIKTLNYLSIRLKEANINTVMIHGGVKNRAEHLNEFQHSKNIQVLLSSEVGSEGLDMQFCDAMVNYDLPWNPMVVEQRIGRIDRFGQKSAKVNIYNLVVANSIQELIYLRLLDRIGIFKGVIGDLEAILDRDLENHPSGTPNLREYFQSLEKELYTTRLSTQEQERKIQEIARATIVEQKNAEAINEQLTNALINDISFRNEIERIVSHKQYVTEKELITFIKQLIRNHLTTCKLEVIDEEQCIYNLCIPKNNTKALNDFMLKYAPTSQDLEAEHTSFRNSIRDKNEISITFSQETAYNNRKLIFINAYHPLILSAMECFKRKINDINNNTFKFKIKSSLIDKGVYYMAIYEIKYEHIKYGQSQETKSLLPLLYDFQKRMVVENTEITKNLLGEAQDNALFSESNPNISDDDLLEMRIGFSEAIDRIYADIFEDQQRRVESVRLLNIQRTEEYYNNQITHQKDIIRKNEYLFEFSHDEEAKKAQQILPALRGRLSNIEDEKEQTIRCLNETRLKRMLPTLQSLSQITII